MTSNASFSLLSLFLCVTPPLSAQSRPALKPPVVVTRADSIRFMSLGRTYTRWLFTAVDDSLAAVVEAPTLERMGGIAGMAKLRARLATDAGKEVRVTEEKLTRRNGELQYWRASTYSAMTGEPLVIRWVLNPQGRIIGAGFGPKSQAKAD